MPFTGMVCRTIAPEVVAPAMSPMGRQTASKSASKAGTLLSSAELLPWEPLAFDIAPYQRLHHWPYLQLQPWQLAISCRFGALAIQFHTCLSQVTEMPAIQQYAAFQVYDLPGAQQPRQFLQHIRAEASAVP